MRRLWILSIVGAFVAALGGSSVSAQDATPAASAAADRSLYIVPPAECVISTLLPGDLNALATAGTPAAGAAEASPVADAVAAPFAVMGGTPADAETDTAVRAVFRQAWACQNGGNLSRYFSLLTPDELASTFTADDVATALGAPSVPLPEGEQSALYAILGVTLLDDGRAGAYVIVDTVANPEPVEVVYMIAAETEKGWKIDDIVTFGADGLALAA